MKLISYRVSLPLEFWPISAVVQAAKAVEYIMVLHRTRSIHLDSNQFRSAVDSCV